MNIAALRVRITFQKNEPKEDEVGNRWNVWTDCFSCWATASRGEGVGAGYESAGAVTVPRESWDFTCRYSREISQVVSTDYRITAKGKIFNIVSADPMGYKNRSVKFRCEAEVENENSPFGKTVR